MRFVALPVGDNIAYINVEAVDVVQLSGHAEGKTYSRVRVRSGYTLDVTLSAEDVLQRIADANSMDIQTRF